MGTVEQPAVEPCDYCGAENPERQPTCPGCGKPLVEDTRPKQKSKGLAYGLTIIFGPIGLLYVGAWWPAAVLIVARLPFFLTHTGGMWVMLGVRFFSVIAVWHYLSEKQPDARREATRLLNYAATLEKKDRAAAVTVYQEVVRTFPNTPASAEAQRNIQVLSR